MENDIVALAVALAVGLLIGLERGWHVREAAEGTRVAGVRTFGLIGLLGGAASLLSQTFSGWVLAAGFVAVAMALTVAYAMNIGQGKDVGITSLVAGLLTFALGALAGTGELAAAAAAAVVTAMLLGFKPVLHRWVGALTGGELQATLKLLLISLVLLPILPNEGYGPWEALNPYQIWWMVVLVAGISFVGYFAIKIAGAKKGVIFTGLFAGLASSTALTLHFARLARQEPGLTPILAAAILLACGTMFPRMVLVAGIVEPALWSRLAIPALVMALIVYLPALWVSYRHQPMDQRPPAILQNPLELGSAVRFGLLLAAIMFLAEAIKASVGEAGLYGLAVVSGLTDVDAITLSLSKMAGERLEAGTVILGIIVAGASNSIAKGGLALGIGGRALGLRVIGPLTLAAACGLGAALWLN